MVVVREFCKKGLPHGNTKTWTLVFDPSHGEFKVRISRTSQVQAWHCEEEPLSAFLTRTGNSSERRALRAFLGRIGSSIKSMQFP